MIEVIQMNLRKMGVARNLLDQVAREVNADILIISEQPRGPADDDRSLSDLDNTAQLVMTRSAATFLSKVTRGRYHVGAAVYGIAVFSCYLPPTLSVTQFTEALEELARDCDRFPPSDLLIAGDFNAEVNVWGSARTDNKGTILEEFAAGLDLLVGNVGDTLTFQAGARQSVIDFTLSRFTGGRSLTGWRVDESMFTGSDHLCIRYTINNRTSTTNRTTGHPATPGKWTMVP